MRKLLILVFLSVALVTPAAAVDNYTIVCPTQGSPGYLAYQQCKADANTAADAEYDQCMAGPPPPSWWIASCSGQTTAACKNSWCLNQSDNYRGTYLDYCESTHCWYDEGSPIILGHPALVGVSEGVDFDIYANGAPVRIGWTNYGSNAFLALDRDHDGSLDGRDLFGNQTSQTPLPGEARNGFVALRGLDSNGDGRIDTQDPVFESLVLWSDYNQDGISQSGEMTPAYLALSSIGTTYHRSRSHDQHGNQFRWKGAARDLNGRPVRLTDVIFATAD